MIVLAVLCGGGLGAVARVSLDGAVRRWSARFPTGTVTVNAAGSLLLGLVVGLAVTHGLPEVWRAALSTGFCGAFTTFSGALLGLLESTRDGRGRSALAALAAQVVLGAGLAATGLAVTGAL